MADPQLSVQQFAARIRGKYPGDYDDMPDDTLTQKVLASYPQYQDMVTPADGSSSQPSAAPQFLRPVRSTPAPDVPNDTAVPAGTISQAPPQSFFERLKNTVANSAVGHSMESTLPKLTDALDLHPTETVNSPDYQSDKQQLVAPQYLVPAEDQGKVANVTRGVLKGAGGLTSGQSMSTMVGAAATGGLLSPAVPVIGRLMALGFSVQTANDLVHQAPQLIDANKRGDDGAFYEGLGRLGFDSVMLATMAKHAATGGAPGEVAPEESAPEAPQSVSPIQSANVPAEAPETQASAQPSAPLPVGDKYEQAKDLVSQFGKASTSMLQRRLRIGYGEAANLVDRMVSEGLAQRDPDNPNMSPVWTGQPKAPESQSAQPSAIPPFLRAKLRAQQVPAVTPDQVPTETGASVAPETAPEPEPAFGKGPGAKTAGTSDNPGSNLADLTRSLPAVESPQASPIDRMKTAAKMAGQQIANVPQKLSDTLSNVESSFGGLWDAYKRPPEWTDMKAAVGKWQGAKQFSAWELGNFSDAMKEAIPDKVRREALTNYVQAGGNTDLLRERAENASPELKPAYEASLNLTPSEKTLAQNVRNYLDAQLDEAQKAGMLEHGVSNYVTQLWKDQDNPVANSLRAEAAASVLNKNPFFTKQRIFDSYMEGEKLGFVPKDKDIGFILSLYHQAFSKAVADRGLVKQLLTAKASDGRPLVATSGVGRTIAENELGEGTSAYMIRPNAKPTEVSDYLTVDSPALRKWKWVASDAEGKPIFTEGDLLAHPQEYKRLRNVLGESAIQQSKIGRAALKLSSGMKQSMLSLSLFHPAQLSIHALEHSVNPLKLPELDLNEPLQRELVDHGLMVADFNSAQEFSEGLRGGGLVNKLPVIGDRLQAYEHYLWHSFIPRLKMEMAKHAFDRNTERYGDKLSQDQILELTARQSNAAFGGLNYSLLGRNKTFQDVLRLTLLAPDFLEARGRFVGQALKPYGREQSRALLLGAATMYTASRILNKLLNGDPDWDPAHAFTIHVGNRSFGLRTVQGDLLHLLTDPRGFAYNRLNPVTTRPAIEAILGRDERGRQRKAFQQLKDIVLSGVPIPAKGLTKPEVDTDLKSTLLQAVGVAGTKYQTKAQRMARGFINTGAVYPESSRSEAQQKLMNQYRSAIDKGKFDANQVWTDVQNGKLVKRDAQELVRESTTTQLSRDVKRLSLDKALQVWDVSNDQEKQALYPVLANKAKLLENMQPEDRAPLEQKLQSALSQSRPMPGFLRASSRPKTAQRAN